MTDFTNGERGKFYRPGAKFEITGGKSLPMQLLQITAPHFTAGVVIVDGVVTDAAPIVNYMRGWYHSRVLNYCQRKGWGVTEA